MTNSKKFFPIKTETACKLKWTWTTLFLQTGVSATCHRTSHYPLSVENFDNFHNNPVVLDDRQRMLNGQWPESNCSYCRKIESSGGSSDRQYMLTIPDGIPPELDNDPTAIVVTPRILEIFINNVCNLSCLYCHESFSSRINQETKKFGEFDKGGVVFKIVNSQTNKFFDLTKEWLRKNYSVLERLNFLGGEPFYQKEFDELLDFLAEHKNSNVEISVTTNLMISEEKLLNYIEKFKKLIIEKRIKRVDITCSIDCWGKEQEFVRYGLDLTQWEKNFKILLNTSWIVLNINQTISSLTVKTAPELLLKLREWRKTRFVGYHFSLVAPGPSFMLPSVLGNEEFKDDFDKILNLMPKEVDGDFSKLEYMQGIATEYNTSSLNLNELKKLFIFLDEKDRRRNTSWQTIFPWLVKYKHYVV